MILAGPEEAELLAAIHAQAFDRSWNTAAIKDLLTAPGVFALTDPDGDGFLMLRTVVDEAEILTLAVRPAARRQGLGRRLTDAAVEKARASGAERLFLDVAADNIAALALYTAAGFEAAGRRAGYYTRLAAPGVDALVLKKPLRPNA